MNKKITTKKEPESLKEAREKFLSKLDQNSADFRIATWFKTGLIIPGPGTWGTLGGMLLGVPVLYLINSTTVFFIGAVLFLMGLQSVERLQKKLKDHDPSFIVIDEVAAILMLIACLPSPSILSLVLGFSLFRYFDIQKPWLVGIADRSIGGAMGVMIDDVVAAIFSLVSFYIIVTIFYFAMGTPGLELFGLWAHQSEF